MKPGKGSGADAEGGDDEWAGYFRNQSPLPYSKADPQKIFAKNFWVYSCQSVDAGGRQSILQRTTNHEWRTP